MITTDDGNARPVHHVERVMVGDKNVILLGTDDLIEIIPGTHVSSVSVCSSAEILPR